MNLTNLSTYELRLIWKEIVFPYIEENYQIETINMDHPYLSSKLTAIEAIPVSFSEGTWYFQVNPPKRTLDFWHITDQLQKRDRVRVRLTPIRNVSQYIEEFIKGTPYDRAMLLGKLIEEKIPQELIQTRYEELNIKERAHKLVAKSLKDKKKQVKKRALSFTIAEQRRIAKHLVDLITEKKGNYLLQVLHTRDIGSDTCDYSGQELVKAMEIFNIDKEEVIRSLTRSKEPMVRRFSALFGGSTISLVDPDSSVRVAAQEARARKKKAEEALVKAKYESD